MSTVLKVDRTRGERADDLAVIEAEMPELAAALRAYAERSAILLARMRASVAEGDRRIAELGLTPD